MKFTASLTLRLRRHYLYTERHLPPAVPTLSFREPCHEGREPQQIVQAKARPPRSHDDERIGLHHVSPAGRNVHEASGHVGEVDPVLTPSSPTVQQLELLTEQGVERMDYPEGSCRRARIGCT